MGRHRRGKGTDHVGLVEACYDMTSSDERWLQRICDHASPSFESGMGTFAFCYDRQGADRMPVVVGSSLRSELSEMIQLMIRNCPREDFRAFCGEGIHYCTGMRRFEERGLSYDALFARHGRVAGIRDARYGAVPTSGGMGVMIGGYTRDAAAIPRGSTRPWLRTLSHIAVGWRLRRRLASGWPVQNEGEAVLSPDGHTVHAEGEARAPAARAALRKAVRRMGVARGRLRNESADEALALWRGLVAGRWSLIDRFDTDGRRYYVAHPNPPGVVDVRRLSRREREVARLVSRGYSSKLIAYELGTSSSTVATRLQSLRRKLRAPSHVALVQVLNALHAGDDDTDVAANTPAVSDSRQGAS